MNSATVTKVLNKSKEYNLEYSLGFSRLFALPQRVRKDINLACVLKKETNDNSMKEHLGSLTEEEYINWLKLA